MILITRPWLNWDVKKMFLVSNYLKFYAISYDSSQDENFFALASQTLADGSEFISVTEKGVHFLSEVNLRISGYDS